MEKTTFSPTVKYNGRTYTLTNRDWLVVYALAGFEWAIKALEQYEINLRPPLWIVNSISGTQDPQLVRRFNNV